MVASFPKQYPVVGNLPTHLEAMTIAVAVMHAFVLLGKQSFKQASERFSFYAQRYQQQLGCEFWCHLF